MNTNKRNIIRFLAVLVLAGLVVVPIQKSVAETCPVSPTDNQLNRTCDPTPTPDPDLIASYNAQIAEKQKKIEDLNDEAATFQSQIDATQGKAITLESELSSIDNQIALANIDIRRKETQLESLELEIRTLQLSIDQKVADMDSKKTILADSIRQLDATSRTTTLAMVMQTGSFSDFYSQAQAQTEIAASLQSTISAIQQARKELENKQGELSTIKDDIQQQKLKLVDQKEVVVQQRDYKDTLLSDTKKSAQQYEQLLDGSQSQVEDVQAEITQLHAALQAKLNANDGTKLDIPSPSGFIWPTPGRKINSGFMDPGYGLNSGRHYGLDIDADQGTYVKATAEGQVARVDPPTTGVYPSVVKIQHGQDANGSYFDTIFIHLSEIFVVKGQMVKQGDIIGRSGGTCYTAGAGKCGWFTTGDHLHYEMHLNNVPVNPLIYLP